jgi:hypothetical protein
MDTPCLDLDLHRLELRFAGARLVEPRAVEGIARSIERGGLATEVMAVRVSAAPRMRALRISMSFFSCFGSIFGGVVFTYLL